MYQKSFRGKIPFFLFFVFYTTMFHDFQQIGFSNVHKNWKERIKGNILLEYTISFKNRLVYRPCFEKDSDQLIVTEEKIYNV